MITFDCENGKYIVDDNGEMTFVNNMTKYKKTKDNDETDILNVNSDINLMNNIMSIND